MRGRLMNLLGGDFFRLAPQFCFDDGHDVSKVPQDAIHCSFIAPARFLSGLLDILGNFAEYEFELWTIKNQHVLLYPSIGLFRSLGHRAQNPNLVPLQNYAGLRIQLNSCGRLISALRKLLTMFRFVKLSFGTLVRLFTGGEVSFSRILRYVSRDAQQSKGLLLDPPTQVARSHAGRSSISDPYLHSS